MLVFVQLLLLLFLLLLLLLLFIHIIISTITIIAIVIAIMQVSLPWYERRLCQSPPLPVAASASRRLCQSPPLPVAASASRRLCQSCMCIDQNIFLNTNVVHLHCWFCSIFLVFSGFWGGGGGGGGSIEYCLHQYR